MTFLRIVIKSGPGFFGIMLQKTPKTGVSAGLPAPPSLKKLQPLVTTGAGGAGRKR
jgi:hypothetical protein